MYEKFASIAQKYLPLEHDKRSAFICVIAHSPADLVREGEMLHHCVGRMNYDQRLSASNRSSSSFVCGNSPIRRSSRSNIRSRTIKFCNATANTTTTERCRLALRPQSLAAVCQQNHKKNLPRKKEETLMANYFRITAYHPQKDVCAVFDSNGMFDAIWQFSSLLVQKGFKITEVGTNGNSPTGIFPKLKNPATKYSYAPAPKADTRSGRLRALRSAGNHMRSQNDEERILHRSPYRRLLQRLRRAGSKTH